MALQRKQGLRRSSGLASSKGLKRTEMKRGTKRIPARSSKMEKIYRERRPLVARMLKENEWCEQCIKIQKIDPEHRCGLRTVDVHEILTRGRGGSILSSSNLVAICRPGHDWLGAHPPEAQQIGLTRWSWEGEPPASEDDGAVPGE